MGNDSAPRPAPEERFTAAQFEALPEGPPYFQLIEYHLVEEPSPTLGHQRAGFNLARKLADFVDAHELGTVLVAPLDVYLDDGNVYEPDILFISNERNYLLADGKYVRGAPDFVVEVLSSNWKQDVETKRYVYELHGVREYWIVDPRKRTVEVFENVRKAFVSVQRAVEGETVYSKLLPGFGVEVSYLFR